MNQFSFICKYCNKKYKYQKSYLRHVDSHKKNDNQKLHLKSINNQELNLKNVESSNFNNLSDDEINDLLKAGLLTPPRQLQDSNIDKIDFENKIDFEKINLN